MNITQISSPNFGVGRKGYVPQIICLHIMAGSLSGTDSWFANTASQVSSHYGIGFNGEIHQYVQDENTAWTNGLVTGWTTGPTSKFVLGRQGINPNLYSLTIEHEGQDLSKAPDTQLNATAGLIRTLTAKYGIPCDRDHIIGHYEIDPIRKPLCPATDKTIIDKIIAMVNQAVTPPIVINDKEAIKTQIISLVNSL